MVIKKSNIAFQLIDLASCIIRKWWSCFLRVEWEMYKSYKEKCLPEHFRTVTLTLFVCLFAALLAAVSGLPATSANHWRRKPNRKWHHILCAVTSRVWVEARIEGKEEKIETLSRSGFNSQGRVVGQTNKQKRIRIRWDGHVAFIHRWLDDCLTEHYLARPRWSLWHLLTWSWHLL